MRIALTDDSIVGHTLVYELRDAEGRVLLGAGETLSARHVELLRRRGYSTLPVHDPLAPDVIPTEPVREELRRQATEAVHSSLQRSERGGLPVTHALRSLVATILSEVSASPHLTCNLIALRSIENQVFVHSVNVCVYTLFMCPALALDPVDRRHLGIGALLHDIGLMFFRDLLDGGQPLAPEPSGRLRGHTSEGFQILRRQTEVDLRAAHVAYQHHERLDGSGYPRGLRGSQIHPWSQVVGVAAAYDALIAPSPAGSALPPHRALAELKKMADAGWLDPFLVKYFCARVAAYPTGSIVRLGSGEIAVVTRQDAKDPHLPLVRVVVSADLRLVVPEERQTNGLYEGTSIVEAMNDYPQEVLRQFAVTESTRPPEEYCDSERAVGSKL